MSVNTEVTTFERLRMITGYVLTIVGLIIFFVIGSFYGFTADWTWIVGLILIISGLLIAKSMALIEFISGFR